jgi:alpha-D-xyloside xylohydrolase
VRACPRERSWRNLYPLWYNRTVAEVVPFVLGRSGWAGSQRYPGQWGGDAECSAAGMAASLRGGLGWAVSAPGLWAHDIGGFSGHGLTPELYVRWAQWGCLSPLARFHGIGPREPWAFGERALEIVREFIELRYRLLPYLLHAAGEAARHGWPMMRPVALEHPGDRGAWAVEHEYLLGSDLLVVPVLDDGPGPVGVPCYLPPGEWVDWWTGEARSGPTWVEVEAPLERLPLFARGGAVVPMGPAMQCTDEVAASEPWTLHVFPGSGRPREIVDGPHTWRPRPVQDATGRVVAVEMAGRRAGRAVVHLPGGLAEVAVRS